MHIIALARVVLAAGLLLSFAAHGQIYRWIDDKGSTVYGNRPPASARSVTRLDVDGKARSAAQMQAPVTQRFPSAVVPLAPNVLSTVDAETVAASARYLERQRCAAHPRADCP